MGMFDSLQQAKSTMGQQSPNAMGQGFAQQVPAMSNNFAQKQQQRANPMMRARPAMSGGFNQQNSMSQTPNPMNGNRPMMNSLAKSAGQMGSRPDVMQRQQALQEQQQAQSGLGPSIPAYEQLKQNLQAQKGGLKTPYDTQQESLANQQQQANPLQAAAEQMRGYEGPDLGSQDPRELARMGQSNPMQGMNQLYGSAPMLQNSPFKGGGNPSFQDMMRGAEFSRPDVMPRGGIGPSFMEQAAPVQMDENGLEPRRGAR